MSSTYYNTRATGGSNNRSVDVSDFQRSPALFLANTGIDFLKRHYVFTMLWVTGLLIVSFAKGYSVDNATQREYREALYTADEIKETKLFSAEQALDTSYYRYYNSKGWFGACDAYCQSNYQNYLSAQEEYNLANQVYTDAVSEANTIVGIFSEYGVERTRQLFWACWKWGKDFAKRISWYDAIFLAFGHSRDESFLAYVLKFVVRILVNFTIGFSSALVSFIWQLWWLVRTYNDGIYGILFFCIGALAAWSLIVTMIVGMYAGTAATVGGVMMMAQNQALQGGRRRRAQHLHYQ